MEMIYLDNNATTRPAGEVVAAMTGALESVWANPSSVHRAGQAARQKLELARESVCRLIGCRDRELVFTSGGTEAANLAIRGSLAIEPKRHVLVTSRLEHSAVRELAESLCASGTEVIWLANDERGIVDLDELRRVLEERGDEIGLVCVMWVNNETGVIQPVEAIGRLCREQRVRFFTDATQWVGKESTDLSALPIDLLGFAAHKFHGPKGIGGLYVRRGIRVEPQNIGGPQERQRRGGTENVPGVVGLGVAADLARAWLATDERERLAGLRDEFERRILEAIEEVSINGGGAPRMWSTTSLAFGKLEAEAILLMLSERGVCASAGAACSSGSVEPSVVLLAMGIPLERSAGSLRFSLCRETSGQEIGRAVEIIVDVIRRLQASLAATAPATRYPA